jgi:hypothetical protein
VSFLRQVPTSWALAEGQSQPVLFLYVHHHLLSNADDAYFKDKSVKAAEAIFKEKEEMPDHVDYEFRVWKGDIPSICVYESMSHSVRMHRDSSQFRTAAKFEYTRCEGCV